ncbi:MAG: hypothetical protein PUF50_08495 [Erysipelotrichaceae bacterium]|nr:hypothetical protein [Erysipelotrichaceae bacterium]
MKQTNIWLIGTGIQIFAFAYVFSGYLSIGCVLCMIALSMGISQFRKLTIVNIQLSDYIFYLPLLYLLVSVVLLPYRSAKAIAFVGLGMLIYCGMLKIAMAEMNVSKKRCLQRWFLLMGIVIAVGMGLISLWVRSTLQWVMIADEVLPIQAIWTMDIFSLFALAIPMLDLAFSSIYLSFYHQKQKEVTILYKKPESFQ